MAVALAILAAVGDGADPGAGGDPGKVGLFSVGFALFDIGESFGGFGVSVAGGFTEPGDGLGGVLLDAFAGPVREAEVVFGVGGAEGGGLTPEGDGLGRILGDAGTLRVAGTELYEGGWVLRGQMERCQEREAQEEAHGRSIAPLEVG